MAGITFNADEIFAMAEEIEVNGAKFYRWAAGRAKDDRSKKILETLAGMEDRHYKIFDEMRKKLADEQRVATVFDPDNEAAAYLKAMADRRVFDLAGMTGALKGNEPMAQVLQIAIGREKESIVFYVGIREFVPEKLGKDKIDDIIREEMSHVTMLTKELASA
jgi:rubrerythrin